MVASEARDKQEVRGDPEAWLAVVTTHPAVPVGMEDTEDTEVVVAVERAEVR